jgi:hypothetical protein
MCDNDGMDSEAGWNRATEGAMEVGMQRDRKDPLKGTLLSRINKTSVNNSDGKLWEKKILQSMKETS